MDRRGAGKVSLKDVLAYLDKIEDLRERAQASCVSLTVGDQGRGLFDLLDTNHDGRLGLREMRQAPQVLGQLDRAGRGYITREDVPRQYQFDVRLGQAGGGPVIANAAILLLGQRPPPPPPPTTRGPRWFRKMDRNRDGDVSRKEFLGTDEEFRAIDTDGDGLISPEEARAFEARRKAAEKP